MIKRRADLTIVYVIASLFFVLNFSGDHVFYKTNTLKLLILAIICIGLSVYLLAMRFRVVSQFDIQPPTFFVLLFSIPVILTLPGLIINGEGFRYHSFHEYTVQILCLIWAIQLTITLNTEAKIRLFTHLSMYVALYMAVIAIAQYVGLKPLNRLWINFFETYWSPVKPVYSGFERRVASTAGHPNYFAGISIQLVPFYIGFYLSSVTSRNLGKAFTLLVVFFLIMSLFLTGSRGGFIGSLVSLIAFFICYAAISGRLLLKRIFYYITVILVTVVLFLVLVDSFTDRLLGIVKDGTLWVRLHIWKVAINSIIASPFFGHGLGSSYSLFCSYADPDNSLYIGRSYLHAHNDLLEVLQEGGVVGLLGYLAVWLILVVYSARFVFDRSEVLSKRVFVLGILSGLIAIHVQGLFSVAPRMVVTRVVTYTLVALLIVNLRSYLPKINLLKSNGYKKGVLIGILVCSFMSLIWLIPYAKTQYSHSRALPLLSVSPEKLVNVAADNHDDVYLLDNAIEAGIQSGHYNAALTYATQAQQLIPKYREVEFDQAFLLMKQGDLDSAFQVAMSVQAYDRYNLKNMQLLLFISLQQNNWALFQNQMADIFKYHACRFDRSSCDKSISLQPSKSNQVSIKATDHEISLEIGRGWFDFLRQYLRPDIKQEALGVKIAQSIGSNSFFTPHYLGSLSQQQLGELKAWLLFEQRRAFIKRAVTELESSPNLTLNAQIKEYFKKRKQLDGLLVQNESDIALSRNGLPEELDFVQFVRKRELLVKISNAIAGAILIDS